MSDGTRPEHVAEPTPLAHATATELRQGVVRLGRRLRRARSSGLSAAKIGILGHLARSGPSGPSDIAAADGQMPQSLTRALAELESGGLIDRSPNDRDGRSVVLSISRAGRDALAMDLRERDEWLAWALGDLSETELGVLRLASPLLDRLADQRPAFGPVDAGSQTTNR